MQHLSSLNVIPASQSLTQTHLRDCITATALQNVSFIGSIKYLRLNLTCLPPVNDGFPRFKSISEISSRNENVVLGPWCIAHNADDNVDSRHYTEVTLA